MKKVQYYLFVSFSKILLIIGYISIPFIRKKKGLINRIAVLPYTPEGWPGGKDRMAAWKPYFEEKGVKYDIYWAWQEPELKIVQQSNDVDNANSIYAVYRKILIRRFKLLFILRNYKSVWIQRAYIPSFPYRRAYFERLASYIHPHIVYDFYDADYIHNPVLVNETARIAYKITVASQYLYDYFQKINPATHFLRYAIITELFVECSFKNKNTIKIGWMGSPDNAKQLLEISSVLKTLESEFDNVVFSFTCRNLPDFPLARLEINKWGENGFSYNEWLAGLDIGIVPYLHPTETVKAKIAMKSLEFMANSVPMVVSPFMHSDMLKQERDVFIAKTKSDWYNMLKKLILSEEKRTSMGRAAKLVFDNYHSFRNNFSQLKRILEP